MPCKVTPEDRINTRRPSPECFYLIRNDIFNKRTFNRIKSEGTANTKPRRAPQGKWNVQWNCPNSVKLIFWSNVKSCRSKLAVPGFKHPPAIKTINKDAFLFSLSVLVTVNVSHQAVRIKLHSYRNPTYLRITTRGYKKAASGYSQTLLPTATVNLKVSASLPLWVPDPKWPLGLLTDWPN